MNQQYISCCIKSGLTPKFIETEMKKVFQQVKSKKLDKESEVEMLKEALNEKMEYLADYADMPLKVIKSLRARWNICMNYR